MRWSETFIPTLKEVPQEAEIASHKLMLRAGLIRRLGAGLYTFLPMGLKALRKVEAIVREEMDRAGAIEVLMPALQPSDIWHQTGRYHVLRDVMFQIEDRQGREMVLGPTHEEIITDLASREINSYRQLPKNFYQIQMKYRDEIRPRFGLMRAKEFLMKDAYSFDVDDEAALESYQRMYDTYVRIFERCGLRAKPVDADTGAMGGSASSEFMVIADSGEDGIVECNSCSYAANLEKAAGRGLGDILFEGAEKALEEVPTPGRKSIEAVARFFECEKGQLVKTLIYMVQDKPVAVLVPGDREVNEIKLCRTLGADAVLASDEQVADATGAPVGFAGPVGLSLPIYADQTLCGMRGGITGANKGDTHLLHVDLERDCSINEYGDFCFAKEGDGCPVCKEGRLEEKRGIEVGHVFKLGTKYSEALGATYLNENGKEQPAVMGCYGIGVTRTLQSLIEQSHDKDGIIWPLSVAPYPVTILVLNGGDERSVETADQLEKALKAEHIEVLYDDRDVRPGFKFKDADLLGMPIRVTIGERGLSKGIAEVRRRSSGETEEVPVEKLAGVIIDMVKEN